MGTDSRGIKVDLKLAMDQAQDIMDATRSLDNLADAVSNKYEDMYNKSSDQVKKFLDKITNETKSTQKVLDSITAGKNLFTIDPRETQKSLDTAKKITIDSLKGLSQYIDENNLKIAQQIGLDPESAEYKTAVSDGVKAYTQYLQEVGKGVSDAAEKFKPEGKGGGSLGNHFGVYFLSNLIGNSLANLANAYEVAPIGVEAGKYQREKTAFDIRSGPGMYQARQMMEMQNLMADTELKAAQTRSSYSTGGQLGGAALGMIAGSFLPGIGTVAGGFIGSQVGEVIGGTLGGKEGEEMKAKTIRENADKQEKMMRTLQTFELMQQYAQVFQGFDVARGMMGAKFGTTDVGGSGIGYSKAELQQLAYQQGSVSGHFDKGTFEEELNFSRAKGYNPQEIFQSEFSSRYTGQQVGANELMARQNLANQTGAGARLPELINSMNQLAMTMTQLTGKSDESGLMKYSSLPGQLFGNDNAYGRLSDLGMPTMMKLNAGMTPEMGSVQSIELLRSYAQGNQRRNKDSNLFDLTERMQQGVFGENNLQDLMTTAMEKSGGNKGMFKSYMGAMTGLNYKQIGLIQDQLDKTEGDTPQEKIENWSKNWEKNVAELKDPAERSAEYLRQEAEINTPKSLANQATMIDKMTDLGSKSYDKVFEIELAVINKQAEIFKDGVTMAQVVKDILGKYEEYYGAKNGTKSIDEKSLWDEIKGAHTNPIVAFSDPSVQDFLKTLGTGVTGVLESIYNNIFGSKDKSNYLVPSKMK